MSEAKPIQWTETETREVRLVVVGAKPGSRDATEADLLAAGYVRKVADYRPSYLELVADRDSWKQRAEEAEYDAMRWKDCEAVADKQNREFAAENDHLRSELARVAKVVEAAKVWRDIWGECKPVSVAEGREVYEAVDALSADETKALASHDTGGGG